MGASQGEKSHHRQEWQLETRVVLRGEPGRGKGGITSYREVLNVVFRELGFPGEVKRTLSPQSLGSFYSPAYLQMRKFFIHLRLVQAA